MATDEQVKLLYVKEVLWRHGDYLVDILQAAIDRLRLKDKGDLHDSIHFDVKEDGAGRPVLRLSFLDYGRAIEIRYHKSKNQKQQAEQRRNEYWKLGNRKYKNTRWYARNVYGSVNRLIEVLATEFTEQEQKRLRHLLETELNFMGTARIPKQ